jgi:ribosomal-protein-alanine N-acetyltransferase
VSAARRRDDDDDGAAGGSANGFEIRPLEAAGVAASSLAELERECLSSPWSAPQLAAELAAAGALPLVALTHEGELAGYALFRSVLDEAELLRVAVRPTSRRLGLGGRLLRRGEELLRESGCTRLHLEVGEGNDAAVALYEGLGWERTGRRAAYYPDGSAALIYTRSLAAGAD